MRPRQDLVSRGYCLAEDGVRYLAYLPEGGDLDIALPEGKFSAQWINARDTQERRPDRLKSRGEPPGGTR